MNHHIAAPAPRFSKSADNHRPYKSHRFEVWSPKLRRRITFFHERSLAMWTLLEADPDVLAFCERPIVVKADNRNIVVDFWVQRATREEILILPRTTKNKKSKVTSIATIDPNLKSWADTQRIDVRAVSLDEIRADQILTANWKIILHYLAANIPLLQPSDIARIQDHIPGGAETSLADIELKLSSDDPILVRTAVFVLLQRGVLRSDDLRTNVLNRSTRFTLI